MLAKYVIDSLKTLPGSVLSEACDLFVNTLTNRISPNTIIHYGKGSSQPNTRSTENTMKTQPLHACCIALLDLPAAYSHTVRKDNMTFVPSRLNEKRQSKGGLGIAIARTNSDDYLIAFYLDGIYDDRKNYKRCFPETNIRLLSKDRHKPHDKYDTIYKIANPPTFDASDLNSHYKPRIRDSQEYGNIVHTPFITGCWQISAAHLKTLEEEGKVLQSASMTILDPDEFFELAPRGIYSLNGINGDI